MSLTDRHGAAGPADREPVLALGDPAYPGADLAGGALTARSRFSLAGGKLPRLLYSGYEAQWVAKAFQDAGVKAGVFTGASATEAGVRYSGARPEGAAPGLPRAGGPGVRQLLRRLALAPGPKGDADPSDDGILTLREIYELDLKGCELAILSACQTNYGPQQKGEGTLALSRGFLVAGVRRVVASNWLVDDEAAASLVSIYCTLLAKAEKQGGPVEYARSLHEAEALGAEAGEVESAVLLGQPRPRRAAVTAPHGESDVSCGSRLGHDGGGVPARPGRGPPRRPTAARRTRPAMNDTTNTLVRLQSCLDRMKAGDPTARDDLIRMSYHRLEALVRRMLKKDDRVASWEQTDDVLQNAALRLWRSLERVAPGRWPSSSAWPPPRSAVS